MANRRAVGLHVSLAAPGTDRRCPATACVGPWTSPRADAVGLGEFQPPKA
jgi:hypothetical protein